MSYAHGKYQHFPGEIPPLDSPAIDPVALLRDKTHRWQAFRLGRAFSTAGYTRGTFQLGIGGEDFGREVAYCDGKLGWIEYGSETKTGTVTVRYLEGGRLFRACPGNRERIFRLGISKSLVGCVSSMGTVAILFKAGILVWNFDSQNSRGITLNAIDWEYRLLLLSPFEDCIVVFSRSILGDTSEASIRFDRYTFDGVLLTSSSLETRKSATIQLERWHIQPRDYNGLYAVVARPCVSSQTTCLIQFDSRKDLLFSDEIPGMSDFRILWKDILISTNYRNNGLLISDLEVGRGLTYSESPPSSSTPEFSQISHDDLRRTGVMRPVCGLIGDENFLAFCWHEYVHVWCFREECALPGEDPKFRLASVLKKSQRKEVRRQKAALHTVV
ncbi:hypothetical protein FGG08_003416 [Glutinoglossum americanum]|uniref:Uncharacterized protein n=1 Tax=Glutinoglossum americanum TaxID=1670608 RepID=A0A9P8IB52_9PEZI|nr:hypothetical protein FGG08_003416 [Glutinoglossum americanum]